MKVTAHEVTSHDFQHAPSTRQQTQVDMVVLKDGMRKRLCKNICRIVRTSDMRKRKKFRIYVRTNEVKANVNVFGAIV